MVKWFIVAILLLPLAEIATFVAIALLIGWTWAFVLTLATTATGLMVLKRGGRLAAAGQSTADRRASEIEAHAGSFLRILGGILLLLPGFLTDIAGALLLLPWVRRSVAARFGPIMPGPSNDRTVIDLEPEEWKRMPDPKKRRGRSSLERH